MGQSQQQWDYHQQHLQDRPTLSKSIRSTAMAHHHDYSFTASTSLTTQQRHPGATQNCESFLANWENWWQQINGTQNQDLQTYDPKKPIPGTIVRNGQNPGIVSPENIPRNYGLNERQICDPTHGIATPIDRFMADNSDNGNLYAQIPSASPHELLSLQLKLDRLGLTESSSPPSERRHDKDRNRRLTQKAECSNAGSKPEQRLGDRQQRRKQSETKRKNIRTRGARRPLGPIDSANP